MLEAIESIYSQLIDNVEIIVVDDVSPDNTNELIREKYPNVLIIENDKNSGPSISRDKGIRAASYEIVIGIDSDVIVEDTMLATKVISKFKSNEDISMLSFRLFTPEKIDDAQRWWHPLPISNNASLEFETDYFSGTGFAVRKSQYILSGGFSHFIYMHYEEVLLSYRFIQNGLKIVYTPDCYVVHNALPTPRRAIMAHFYKPRNQIFLAFCCMNYSKAFFFLAPRLIKNFFTAVSRNELKTYFSAIRAAIELTKRASKERIPLSRRHWRKMKLLRK
jgi:GT2 family glycosyltransferase